MAELQNARMREPVAVKVLAKRMEHATVIKATVVPVAALVLHTITALEDPANVRTTFIYLLLICRNSMRKCEYLQQQWSLPDRLYLQLQSRIYRLRLQLLRLVLLQIRIRLPMYEPILQYLDHNSSLVCTNAYTCNGNGACQTNGSCSCSTLVAIATLVTLITSKTVLELANVCSF